MVSQLVKGSIAAIAQETGTSIAESFINADTMIIVDVSASMHQCDARRNGLLMSRYKAACNELAQLQCTLPGKLAVIAFSDTAQFCPNGVPPLLGGSTDLAEALRFVQIADGCGIRFILISDGEPDDEHEALQVASHFTSRIDTVFVGPEGGAGAAFLQRLAALHDGAFVFAGRTQDLAEHVHRLLLTQGGVA